MRLARDGLQELTAVYAASNTVPMLARRSKFGVLITWLPGRKGVGAGLNLRSIVRLGGQLNGASRSYGPYTPMSKPPSSSSMNSTFRAANTDVASAATDVNNRDAGAIVEDVQWLCKHTIPKKLGRGG